jgi:hypothetical protein
MPLTPLVENLVRKVSGVGGKAGCARCELVRSSAGDVQSATGGSPPMNPICVRFVVSVAVTPGQLFVEHLPEEGAQVARNRDLLW